MSAAELTRALETGRDRLASARLLWRGGRLADAYACGTEALQTLATGWGQDVRGSLEAAGYPRLAELEQTLAAIEALPRPQVEREFGRAHQRGLERACAAAESLADFTARRLRPAIPPRARVWRRLAIALAACLAGIVAAVWMWRRPLVSASAVFSADFPARQAIDGLRATEWLLPDDKEGWIELAFRSPRDIHSVYLRNAHNRTFNDRATKRFRVTAYAGLRPVAAVEDTFDGINVNPVRRIPLPASAVTRVRVEVLSYFNRGGGLAEVDVE